MEKQSHTENDIIIHKEDAKIIKEILELEKTNIEAHRIARNEKEETAYEKRLEKITENLATT